MSYNTNNVWIESDDGFIRMEQTGFLSGYIRPTYKVLAEGDSWFHIGGLTGFGKARNVIDELNFNNHHTMVCNMAMSGDTMSNMADRMGSPYFYTMLKTYKWDCIVLSAGGNDLIDSLSKEGGYRYKNKTLAILQANPQGAEALDYINIEHLNLFCEALFKHYQKFIEKKKKTQNSDTPVFVHTYDYPTPRNSPARMKFAKIGPWIYPVLKECDVPKVYWQEIVDKIFAELAKTLISLDDSDHFTVVKTFGLLERAEPDTKGNSNDWLNEIHPNAKGIKKIANAFNEKLKVKYE